MYEIVAYTFPQVSTSSEPPNSLKKHFHYGKINFGAPSLTDVNAIREHTIIVVSIIIIIDHNITVSIIIIKNVTSTSNLTQFGYLAAQILEL